MVMRRNYYKHHDKDLIEDTYLAFLPWLNISGMGKLNSWVAQPHPYYLLDKDFWANKPFNNCRYYASIFNKTQVRRAIYDGERLYYTGKQGRSLRQTITTIDVDAHRPWQTAEHVAETKKVLLDFLGKWAYPFDTNRGFHAILKIDYSNSSAQECNQVISELVDTLELYIRSKGGLADLEHKGTIGVNGKYGSLARLPINKDWSYAHLERFNNVPVIKLEHIRYIIDTLNERINYDAVRESEALIDSFEKPRNQKIKTCRPGSTTQLPLSQEQVEMVPALMQRLRNTAYYCMTYRQQPKQRDVKLTYKDFCQFLIVQSIIYQNQHGMNHERENPTECAKAIWERLRQLMPEEFNRAWNYSRYAAMRNTIADRDMTVLISEEYYFFEDGTPGKAMQWHIKEEFLVEFDENKDSRERTRIYAQGNVFTGWRPRLVGAPELDDSLLNEPEYWMRL